MLFVKIVMNTFVDWCDQWRGIYRYTLQAIIRARQVAPLARQPFVSMNGAATGALNHARSLSSRTVLQAVPVDNRIMAYHAVHLLCNDRRRVEGHSAMAVMSHMLELSVRWWLSSLCADINKAVESQILPSRHGGSNADCVAQQQPMALGVCDENFLWGSSCHLFTSIEAETALRSALKQVLEAVHQEVLPDLDSEQKCCRCEREGELDDHHAVMMHAYSTLARHCFIMERILHTQFLYLEHNNPVSGNVSRMLRVFVRELLTTTACKLNNSSSSRSTVQDSLLRVGSSYVLAASGGGNECCNSTTQTFVDTNGDGRCTTLLMQASLIFALFDVSGLSSMLSDFCDSFEAACDAFGKNLVLLRCNLWETITDAATRNTNAETSSRQLMQLWLGAHNDLCVVQQLLETFFGSCASSMTTFNAVKGKSDIAKNRVRVAFSRLLNGFATQFTSQSGKHFFDTTCDVFWESFAANCQSPACATTLEQAALLKKLAAQPCFNESKEPQCASDSKESSSSLECMTADDADALKSVEFLALTCLCQRHERLVNAMATHLQSSAQRNCCRASGVIDVERLIAVACRATALIRDPAVRPEAAAALTRAIFSSIAGFLATHERAAVSALIAALQQWLLTSSTAPKLASQDGAVTDDAFPLHVSKVASLLPSKDVLVLEYATVLGRRLLQLHAAGLIHDACALEQEALVVRHLSHALGTTTVSTLSSMLRDVSCGVRHLAEETSAATLASSTLLEVCSARWRYLVAAELLRTTGDLEREADLWLGDFTWRAASAFETLLGRVTADAKGTRRLLHWAMCSGSISVLCHYPTAENSHVTLTAPPYVALILSHLQQHRAVRLKETVAACRSVPPAAVRGALMGLASAGIIGVAEGASSDPSFHLLEQTRSKQRKVRIGFALTQPGAACVKDCSVAHHGTKEPVVTDALLVERQRKMEAVIVRILKQRKKCSHKELSERCVELTSHMFDVSSAMLKNAIGELIAREFLQRCTTEDGAAGYEYLA